MEEYYEKLENGQWNIVDAIIEYEQGRLGADETYALFQRLVDTGMAWQLQGSYGREAARLIDAGVITR